MTKPLTGHAYLAAVRHGIETDRALQSELARHEGNVAAWAESRGLDRQALWNALTGRGAKIVRTATLVFEGKS